ncbi:PulJ/GspJ family protein [Flavobacterium sp. PLA-1-15]|uniref:PulJ/GspJ family protein n=1 Tax=Flavobacterium sp. PLA-1-15 TaxID=3380533 RepID=UPI003B7AEC64
MQNKVKSFTLAELLVVMIITAIVVGMAFSVLHMIQKQVRLIHKNLDKSADLSLFEQKLWQDFNEFHHIEFNRKDNILVMKSEMDSVLYNFNEEYVMRNTDTIKLKIALETVFYEGLETVEGEIDAVSISGEKEFPGYKLFVSKKNDATLLMNTDGI